MLPIQLTLISHATQQGFAYQHLHIQLTETVIQPQAIRDLQLPPIQPDQGIVLEGKAPLWLYCYLASQCRQALWIGCYEPRLLSAIVVASHSQEIRVGETLPIELPIDIFRKTPPNAAAEQRDIVMNAELELQLIQLQSEALSHQTLAVNISNRVDANAPVSYVGNKPTLSNLIPPRCLSSLSLPEALNLQAGVILFGSAPTWLYTHLLDRLLDPDQAAPWIACFDLRSQAAIVVHSQIPERVAGDLIPIRFNQTPGIAILIAGPPNSGKSVLSNALRCSIQRHSPQLRVYLHRANWDGEGNFTYESAPSHGKRLADESKIKLHCLENADELIANYFDYQAKATQNIRSLMDLVLVDVGGVPDVAKNPVIVQCSDYIVISHSPDQVPAWHHLCGGILKPLAVIHSKLERCANVLQIEPFLELEAGVWQRGETDTVPEVLLRTVLDRVQMKL